MKRSVIYTLVVITSIWLSSIGCTSAFGKDFVLVLDAGHGGHDPGAIGSFSREKNINLSVALKVGRLIEQNCSDVKVIFTRKTDVFIPLNQRTEIANNAGADLFISIHTNSAPTKAAKGTETFSLGLSRSSANLAVAKRENSVILMEDDYKQRYAGFNPNSSESYIMFEFIQDKHMEQSVSLATLIQRQYRSSGGRQDRGVHQDIFLVLKTSAMPSVLTELGFISNPEEEQFLNSEEGMNTLAKSIFRGFLQYKIKHDNRLSKGHVPYRKVDEMDIKDPKDTSIVEKAKVDTIIKPQRKIIEKTPKEKEKKAEENKNLVFKIQLFVSTQKIKDKDSRLKGLSPVESYNENGLIKYTYGCSEDYNEILTLKKEIAQKFKDAFIIAFKNGDKININTAISEFKKNKK